MAELFSIFKSKKKKAIAEENPDNLESFAHINSEDGSIIVEPGAFQHTGVDYSQVGDYINSEVSLIKKYRELLNNHDIDNAVTAIVDEMVVQERGKNIVSINLDNTDFPDQTKNKLIEEHQNVLNLLNFNKDGYSFVKDWYVDGKIYFHKIIDDKKLSAGIKGLRKIDPRSIKRVKEVESKRHKKNPELKTYSEKSEHYIYNPSGDINNVGKNGVKISSEAVAMAHSGKYNVNKTMILSHLHNAIKPYNRLRNVEDASIIYRLARAPERRIFYIDVGQLPKNKSEQHVAEIKNRFRNKLSYNISTGEVMDQKRIASMTEDFWIPRTGSGRSTEIDTLPGGQNLAEMEDVEYFEKSFYRALKVPMSRLERDSGFSMGRTSEITRDEIIFYKFIKRLQQQFSQLFLDLLKTQVLLKNIVTPEEWEKNKTLIYFDWLSDSYFNQLKALEIQQERANLLRDFESYVGTFYSKRYIQKNILGQTDEEIEQINKEIKEEGSGEDEGGGRGRF